MEQKIQNHSAQAEILFRKRKSSIIYCEEKKCVEYHSEEKLYEVFRDDG